MKNLPRMYVVACITPTPSSCNQMFKWKMSITNHNRSNLDIRQPKTHGKTTRKLEENQKQRYVTLFLLPQRKPPTLAPMKGETGSVLQVRQPKADRDCIMHAPLVGNQKFWWKKRVGSCSLHHQTCGEEEKKLDRPLQGPKPP